MTSRNFENSGLKWVSLISWGAGSGGKSIFRVECSYKKFVQS